MVRSPCNVIWSLAQITPNRMRNTSTPNKALLAIATAEALTADKITSGEHQSCAVWQSGNLARRLGKRRISATERHRSLGRRRAVHNLLPFLELLVDPDGESFGKHAKNEGAVAAMRHVTCQRSQRDACEDVGLPMRLRLDARDRVVRRQKTERIDGW